MSGNPAKIVKGTELGLEYDNIATMSATKEDSANKGIANGYTGNNALNQSTALAFVPSGSTVPASGMYLSAANTLAFASNTTLRLSINSTGNLVLAAPSAGAHTLNTFTNDKVGFTITDAINYTGTFGRSTLFTNAFWIGAAAGNTLVLGGGAREAITVDGSGKFTLLTPASGTAFTINGASASQTCLLVLPADSSSIGFRIVDPGANVTNLRLNTTNTKVQIQATGTTQAMDFMQGATVYGSLAFAGQWTLFEALNGINALKNAATYETGTFTGTLTGMTAGTTGTITWTRNGNLVTLTAIAAITGTSNTTALTMTGLPANLQPATCPAHAPCGQLEANGTLFKGTALVAAGSGTITMALDAVSGSQIIESTTAFGAVGVKGLGAGWTISYQIQ